MTAKIWTDEKIEETLRGCMKKLNIEYLPTDAQMHEYNGNKGMYAALQKRGTMWWANKLGVLRKREYNQFLKYGNEYPKPKLKEKVDFAVYKDEKRLKHEKARDEAYAAQCQASEVKTYRLSQKELAKYQRLPIPEKGTTSVEMINALASAWGQSKARSMEKLEL